MSTTLVKLTAPCSYLDIEKFQTWLEDLSTRGYLLSKRAGTRHNYLFHPISPLKTRYRLTPVSDNLEDWNERPDTEKQTLSEAFGWEYVCTVDGFHIYRSYSEEDRELNSDPDVLAESLRLLRRKALLSALAVVIAPALYLALMMLLVGYGNIWRYLIDDGVMLFAGCALLYLFVTLMGIDRSIKLFRLTRLLKTRKLPTEYRDWKKGEKRFHFNMRVTYAMGFALIFFVSMIRLSDEPRRQQSFPEDSSILPFVTLMDLAERSDFHTAERLDAGWMIPWSQPFATRNYEWFEAVDVVTQDGTEGRFSLEIFYHELNSDWLADRVTEEYVKEAQSTGTSVDAPSPAGVDFAYFYRDSFNAPAALLRRENTVIRVTFMRIDLDAPFVNLDTWIDLSAQKWAAP